ncbi:MAG: hypothetical protein JST67_00025 [Bacteroidetes bacterium]|nr:hypothetical protein [Bacteroidota bacterium]
MKALQFGNIKTTLIISVVVILLLISISWYFYYKGSKKTVIAPLVQDNPSSQSSQNNPAGISDTDVKQISSDIENEIHGYHVLGHDPTPYQRLLSLSDTDFVRVYNQWNTDYQQSEGQTLAKMVAGEWVLYDPAWDALQTSMNERFSKLNLI